MKRRRRVLFVGLICATIAVIGAVIWPREEEPVYEGKKLSEWILLYTGPGDLASADKQKSAKALSQIGTNSLPFVLKWMRRDRQQIPPGMLNRMWGWLLSSVNKLPVSIRGRFLSSGSGVLPERAHMIFGVREFDGTSAIPELIDMGTDPFSPNLLQRSSWALQLMAPHSVPAMLSAVSDRTRTNRYILLEIIANVDADGRSAKHVPTLIGYLADSEPSVSMSAARVLGNWSLDLTNAVPALVRTLEHSNWSVRASAASALGNIGKPAASAAMSLARYLQDPELTVRREVTNALRMIGRPEFLDSKGQ
jgi:hypothetical protein